MRVTTDYHEFYNTARIILCRKRLRKLGIPNDDITGSMWPNEIEEAMELCKKNSAFHIVSCMKGGIFLNRYDERGFRFKLAEGDADPNYVLDARHLYDWLDKGAAEEGTDLMSRIQSFLQGE